MADWVWVESPGTGLKRAPRVRATQFGDGYQARSPDGLNANPQEWDYVANDVDDAIAADMMDFLDARGGVEPFSYVPLWQTTAIQVYCPEWSRSQGSQVGMSNVHATFKQWFGP